MHSATRGCWQAPFGPLDWTPCFRETVVNGAVSLTVAAVSAIALAVHLRTDQVQRRKAMERQVAQLNPDSSHFVVPEQVEHDDPSADCLLYTSPSPRDS